VIRRNRRCPRSRGQALVELAVLAPVLLLLLTGGAQVAVVVYSQISVTTAAREAGRTAADNPKDSQLFPAPVAGGKDCTSSSDTRKVCVAAYNSTTTTFGLVNPSTFTVQLSSAQYPSGTSTVTCSGTAGTADDGLVTVKVSYHAPIFVPFVDKFFADPGHSYRTVTNTVTVRINPCTANGGN
jgi:Flp pilus assembly protein TadG